jgi:hypothetical protein
MDPVTGLLASESLHLKAKEPHLGHAGDQVHRENPLVEMVGYDGKALFIHEFGYTGSEIPLLFSQQGIGLVEIHGSPFHHFSASCLLPFFCSQNSVF